MSRHTSIRNLQIITALDSLSYGLIYQFLPAHIEKLGGSQANIGILTIGILIGELFSPRVTGIFTHCNGNRHGLFFIFSLSMLTHIMMVITSSCWFSIMMKIMFSAINQSQNLCLALLLDKERNLKTRSKLLTNYNVLSGSGFILGPIISGYFFDKENGFRYIGMLAAFLALTNVILLTTVDNLDKSNNCRRNTADESVVCVSEKFEELKKCELEKHWDILVLKYLFASSILIFFSKFVKILKHNCGITSSVTIGYTAAYMNALVFAFTSYIAEAKENCDQYPLVFVSELAFFLISIFTILACYAPNYEYFLFLLVPIIFLRTLIMAMWEDLFSERHNESLSKLNYTAGVSAGLTIPLLFGITCDQIDHHKAVIFFTCVPLLLCWTINRMYSRFLKIECPAVLEGDHHIERKNC